jgi:ribonuclease R
MQRLLDEVRGTPAEAAANLLLLQSLAQACYSPSVEGHFALASEHYCHFTSPIRRYPDLVIHRLVNELVASQRGRRGKPEQRTPTTEQLVEIGEHTSATERRAQDAEREAIFLLLLDLMKQKVGEVLTGTVSGLASFGAFIRLQPYLAEGLVHVSELGPDDWDYDEQASMFVGRRSGKVIALGQSVKVLVAAVDELRQTITLVAAERGGLGVSGGRMQALQHRSRQRKKSVRKSARSERRGAKTARRGRQRRP